VEKNSTQQHRTIRSTKIQIHNSKENNTKQSNTKQHNTIQPTINSAMEGRGVGNGVGEREMFPNIQSPHTCSAVHNNLPTNKLRGIRKVKLRGRGKRFCFLFF
jgi:hypothetical protein